MYTNIVTTKFDNFTFNTSDVLVFEAEYTITNNCEDAMPETTLLSELEPLTYGTSTSALYSNCCYYNDIVSGNMHLLNPKISGCGCCDVTSWANFYNRS
jgi:hypothetical protein